jgi:hypothetical protein
MPWLEIMKCPVPTELNEQLSFSISGLKSGVIKWIVPDGTPNYNFFITSSASGGTIGIPVLTATVL